MYAYNTSKHESSKYNPFEIMLGWRAVLPNDLAVSSKVEAEPMFDDVETDRTMEQCQKVLEAAKSNILIAQQRQKK